MHTQPPCCCTVAAHASAQSTLQPRSAKYSAGEEKAASQQAVPTCAMGCAGAGCASRKSSYEIRLCLAVSASTDITFGSSSCRDSTRGGAGAGGRVEQPGVPERRAARAGAGGEQGRKREQRTQSTSAGMGMNTGSLCAALTWLSPACEGGHRAFGGGARRERRDRMPGGWPPHPSARWRRSFGHQFR